MSEQNISADFPFESNYVNVHGSRMHYVDTGEGDPVLFLHGNPTSSYLWRNIIPHVSPHARCIAPDLIGMGKSDKPDLAYRFKDHARYLEGFIEELGLKNITLVIHDWGSGLGFDYAMRHQENIKGIAFMEAIVKPASWSEFPAEFKMGFKMFRTPGIGFGLISVANVFINVLLPQAVVRKMTRKEIANYNAPYKTIKSRKPIRQWPSEIPIDGNPRDVHEIVNTYSNALQKSKVPKLFFSVEPGGIIGPDVAQWCRDSFPNLTEIKLGKGIHYVQEDHPQAIGKGIAEWYRSL